MSTARTQSQTMGPFFHEALLHSAKVPDQDGIERLLEPARSRLPRRSYLWVDAGYRGRGKEWAERELGVEVEVVNRHPKPPPRRCSGYGPESGSGKGARWILANCLAARPSRTSRGAGLLSAHSLDFSQPTDEQGPRKAMMEIVEEHAGPA